jgi:hypothetical protein
MVNPFEYADPVAPPQLVDRHAELDMLADQLVGTHNTRIIAPRRYGKTSLVRAALEQARNDGLAAVYVNFLGVLTADDVAVRIERAYAESLEGSLRRWLTGVLRTLRPTVGVGGGLPVTAQVSPQPREAALLDRLALPRRIAEKSGGRCAIVFDEFQEIMRAGVGIDATIRSEIEQHANVAGYIFAGSHAGMMEELFADRRRAFYAQARPLTLEPLPADELGDFVAATFEAHHRDAGDALGPLLDTARGHPQRAMLLAHHLFAQTPANASADTDAWSRALAAAFRDSDGEVQATWGALSLSRQRVAAVVADGTLQLNSAGAGQRYGLSRGGASAATARSLAAEGLLAQDPGARSGWRVVDPLIEIWIRSGRAWPAE